LRIDIRPIASEFFSPSSYYSVEEEELFKTPSKLEHFKKRIDLLLKRQEKNRLIFLPDGDEGLLKAIKLHVLNKIPTKNAELTGEIYEYIFDRLPVNEFKKLVNHHANYIKRIYK